MPVQKTCLECGSCFECRPSQAEIRKFCSRACKGKHQGRRLIAAGTWYQPVKPRRGTETPCLVCGKAVYATDTQRQNGQGLTCSRKCSHTWQRREQTIKKCGYCGQEMRLRPSQSYLQYCSKDCEARARTKRPLDRIHNGKPARKDKWGYVLVYEPDHPGSVFKGWIHEHRLVVEKALGRRLAPGEEVHHVNAVKDDNRLENLQVLGKSEHCAETAANNWGRLSRVETELEEYRKRFGPLS